VVGALAQMDLQAQLYILGVVYEHIIIVCGVSISPERLDAWPSPSLVEDASIAPQ
jgi:hypothetical protein